MLKRIEVQDIPLRRAGALDAETLNQASRIVEKLRQRGQTALRAYAEHFDGLAPGQPLVLGRPVLEAARDELPATRRALFRRTADRIRRFADAQRASLSNLSLEIPGGRAGQEIWPLRRAGCYAPGGRYPLVSSMLMTVVTARAAGVEDVWAASPRPSQAMLAAAAIAGADAFLTAGGAHAVGALAYGAGPVPPCDVIVGPGNRWVTAAKHVVSSDVRIDMLAGPSELLVLADASADAALVAADLLAQAEHDPDACPMLISTSAHLIDAVNRELARQLETLATAQVAAAALTGGFAAFVPDLDDALGICDALAPEHLALHVREAQQAAERIRRCGCLFVGSRSAEVFGDYGAGPNHTLPTGGTARFASGLSVLTFLRFQTWLRLGDVGGEDELCADAAALARLEGLAAHARSVELRQPLPDASSVRD